MQFFVCAVILSHFLISNLHCAEKKADEKKIEQVKDRKAQKKNVTGIENHINEKQVQTPEKKTNDILSEGDLRIKIKSMQEIIEHDRGLLVLAEKNYDSYNNYDGDPIKNKRLARKYKGEVRSLKRRIAVHEGMVKQWESVLIQTTGKM